MLKKLLVTTLLPLVMFSCAPAHAKEVKEMYVQMDTNVKLVITNGECLQWKAPEHVQLNFAYALNEETKETVTGCFTHIGDDILIELTDGDKKRYSFKIKADNFQVKPNL